MASLSVVVERLPLVLTVSISIYDETYDNIRACSDRHKRSAHLRRNSRWKKLFQQSGLLRRPTKRHFDSMCQHKDFDSCFAACSDSIHKGQKETSFQIGQDSGASVCITPDKRDFLTFTSQPGVSHLHSVSSGHDAEGEGMVLWSVVDTTGMLRHFKVKAYYVPSSYIRLLSLHALLQHNEGESITVENDCLILSGVADNDSRNSIRVPFHPVSRLPISTAYRYNDMAIDFLGPVAEAQAIYSASSAVSPSNSNLSEAEKELLRWHFKLGHIAFTKVQALMRTGVLSHSEGTRRLHRAAANLSTAPKCAACTFAK